MTSRALTELEKAITTFIDIFSKYAANVDGVDTLTSGEFKKLVTDQLPNFRKNVEDLEEKMESLDDNRDQEVKFGEYWRLIGKVAKEVKKEKVGKK